MAMVKICGLRDEAMVRVAAEAGADWVGFVLVQQSPRYIGQEGALLADRLTDLLFAAAEVEMKSAVLVANPDPVVLRILSGAVQPDVIQLHGQETPEFVAELRSAFAPSIEIWKALGVETAGDLKRAEAFGAADRLLIDAKPPSGAAYSGGHGAAFDWSVLEDWTAPKPWLLAGGLTPDNVASAIAATGAAAVDVSSGVERERGVKDAGLIRKFVAAARSAKSPD